MEWAPSESGAIVHFGQDHRSAAILEIRDSSTERAESTDFAVQELTEYRQLRLLCHSFQSFDGSSSLVQSAIRLVQDPLQGSYELLLREAYKELAPAHQIVTATFHPSTLPTYPMTSTTA